MAEHQIEQMFAQLHNIFNMSSPFMEKVKITTDEIKEIEYCLDNGADIDEATLTKLNGDPITFLSYVIDKKSKTLWSFSKKVIKSFWVGVSETIQQSAYTFDDVIYFDDNAVENSIIETDKRTYYKYFKKLEQKCLPFRFIRELTLNGDKTENDKIITLLTQNKSDEYFTRMCDIINESIKQSNMNFSSGYFDPITDSAYGASSDMQLKMMYTLFLLIKHEGININVRDTIFNTINYCIMRFYSTLFVKNREIAVLITKTEEQAAALLNIGLDIEAYSFYSSVAKYKKIQKEYESIINNITITDILNNHFRYCIAINKLSDDVLYSLVNFYNNNDNLIDKDIVSLYLNIISSKTVTSNPHVKKEFLAYAIRSDKNNELFRESLTDACINFFNDVELSKDDSMAYEKEFIRMDVYTYFKNRFNGEDIKKIDEYKIKMFVNFIVRDITQHIEFLKVVLQEYIQITDDLLLQTKTSLVNRFIDYLTTALNILFKFVDCKDIKNNLLSPEILIRFRTLASESFNIYNEYVLGDIGKKLKEIENYVFTKIEIQQPAHRILHILGKIEDKESLSLLFCDGGINKDIYNEIALIFSSEDADFKIIDTSDIIDKTSDVDYPDDLLDQITYEPLDDPVIIPGTDIIVNRRSIVQYIMTDGLNPYTKQPLTIDDLDSFNKKEESLLKIENIRKKLEEFVKKSD